MKKMLILISLIFILSGCYNYKELNEYAIATGMAIDYEDGQYEVSMLISNSPKSNNDSNNEYQSVVYSGNGDTIYDAIKDVVLISPKQIYIGHLSIVVISEEAAKVGLMNALNFLLTDPSFKKNFYVALANGDKAKNILSITTPLTDFPSQTLADNLKSTDHLQGSIVAVDFNTLMYQLVNPGINPVLNSFIVIGDELEGADESNVETNLPKAYIKLSTLGIFKNDKFITWATKDESRGINIINDKVSELYIEVECEDGIVVIGTENLKTKRNITKDGKVTVETSADGLINEITCDIDLDEPANIDKIEQEAEIKVKSFMEAGLTLAQTNKTDLFGIGLKYYQDYPKEFENIDDWNEYFANLEFNFKVTIDINHTGSIQQSLERIMNEKNN